MYCVNMVSVIVMLGMVSEVVGQAIKENENMDVEDMGTVEGFIKTKEFKVSCGRQREKAKIALNYCY